MTALHTKEKAAPEFLEGIETLAERYDHFILDIYGVIHDGIRPFPGTLESLERLNAAGKQVCLLSNSPKRADGAARQMEAMGISRDLYHHIVTSGEATHMALKNRSDAFHQSCGHDCWFIAPPSFHDVLHGLGIKILDNPDKASFILNAAPGIDDGYEGSLEKPLEEAAANDLPMICANPDLVVNIGDQQFSCAGTFARLYKEMGGRVVYHGKPHQPVYERCRELLGNPDKSKIIALGDSLHTDIAGANNFGIDSVFNLVGIHWEEVQIDHRPGIADFVKIKSIIAAQKHRPTYAMAGLDW